MHFDLAELVKAIGYIGVFAIVFAESGLFFGFFLPGDSLLFTAGFVASQGYLSFPVLVILCVFAAILGDQVGYVFGHKLGKKLFEKEDSKIFKKKHLMKAQAFYEKHGGKTIILARFIPVVRTFAPIVAGSANMVYRKFLAYNIVGGLLWAVGLTFAGYFLGNAIPDIDKYIIPVIFLIILLSGLPPMIHILKDKDNRKEILNAFRRLYPNRKP